MPHWLRRMLESGERVVTTPGRIESQVTQTATAVQHAIDQFVFWTQVALVVFLVVSVARAIFALYNWNLRRREVLAEEEQAKAETRQAKALEAILTELRQFKGNALSSK